MPWLATDREAIRRHLAIPASTIPLDHLDVLMGEASAASITTSQTAIDKLNTLETTFQSKASEDLGLIRADVLEWQPGSPEAKLSGIRAQQAYWREQLSLAIGYDGRYSNLYARQGGQAELLRS
jgi:hypothetical protein